MIIGPEHGLVHISSVMTIDFSFFVIKRPLPIFSSRNQTGMSLCLTLGVTILASTTEIQIVLSYQCTVGESVWIDSSSMYLRITIVLFTALYMHLIYPSVGSETISG